MAKYLPFSAFPDEGRVRFGKRTEDGEHEMAMEEFPVRRHTALHH
jgi:hypothetical protein